MSFLSCSWNRRIHSSLSGPHQSTRSRCPYIPETLSSSCWRLSATEHRWNPGKNSYPHYHRSARMKGQVSLSLECFNSCTADFNVITLSGAEHFSPWHGFPGIRTQVKGHFLGTKWRSTHSSLLLRIAARPSYPQPPHPFSAWEHFLARLHPAPVESKQSGWDVLRRLAGRAVRVAQLLAVLLQLLQTRILLIQLPLCVLQRKRKNRVKRNYLCAVIHLCRVCQSPIRLIQD